jgi:hypothetical protein
MLCARICDLGDLERATAAVAADPTVRFFFAVDFDLLTPPEREILLAVAQDGARPEDQAALLHLERLGLIPPSPILRQWLRDQNV